MKKIQRNVYFEKGLLDRLNSYCEKHNKKRNGEVTSAIEYYLDSVFDNVEVSMMTIKDAQKKWNEVNTKIYCLKKLEKELYERLEELEKEE